MVECLSQKSEGVVMFIKIKAINFIAGSKRIQEGSDKIFDEKIIDFLNTVSIQIMNKKNLKNYPDLITFGFWCRKSNIIKIKKDYKLTTVSRGIVLHICPSNVPMNFAFSMVFGLLSGNSNIIRLPSIEYQQVKEFCNIIKKIIKIKKFSFIKNKLCLISYKKSDEISSALSKLSDARMLWGGDETIQKFKEYPTKPRCIDLNFANRYSFSVINSKFFNKLNDNNLNKLVTDFYTDSFLMDQNGCSSPKGIFWVSKVSNLMKERFWKKLTKNSNKIFEFNLSKTSKKLSKINEIILKHNKSINFNYKKFKIVRIKLNKSDGFKFLENIQPGYGIFFETGINNLKELKNILLQKLKLFHILVLRKKKKRLLQIINFLELIV